MCNNNFCERSEKASCKSIAENKCGGGYENCSRMGNCGRKNCGGYGTQTLAMINFPIQNADWDKTYSPEKALCTGTIFPELNLPYMGERRSV